MSFAFGADRRIRRRVEFLRIQSNGERTSTRHFVFLVAARSPLPSEARGARAEARESARACSRIGIVVTRKVGNSVQRSRIKRLCRECFRLWPGFVPDGVDLVVIARANAHTLDLAQVRREWEGARRSLLERCRAALERGTPVASPARRATVGPRETSEAARESAGGARPEASSSARENASARRGSPPPRKRQKRQQRQKQSPQ